MSLNIKTSTGLKKLNSVIIAKQNLVSPQSVNFYDYDGELVYAYTAEEFAQLSALPTNPTHDGLTAQGWNWSLSDAKAYVANYGALNIGQSYITSDGKTRLYIHLEDGRLEPTLGLGINGSVDVDWGDGSAHDTMTGDDITTTVRQLHRYAEVGDYVITLTVTGNAQFNGGGGIYSYILNKDGESNAEFNQVYLNILKKIHIGSNMTFGDTYSFGRCHSLQLITIPNSITNIGNASFYDCGSLRTIVLPNGMTTIDAVTFYYCYSLQKVLIPNGITNIGNNIFYYCYSLEVLSIPDSITQMGGGIFYYCRSLQTLIIPDSVTTTGSGICDNNHSLQKVRISNNMTQIASGSFSNCNGLQSVIIPASISTIGTNAFNSCRGLGYIKFNGTIPPTVNGEAFNNVPNDCYILVPYNYFDEYFARMNMPSPETYLYLCYATYTDGDTLPTVDNDGYTLTWYASREDARAETNPITVGNGKEIYARGVRA